MNSADRRDRVLVLHSYPPVPCLYTFEKGLRELGHDVVSVGPEGPYGDPPQFGLLEPGCVYRPAEPDARLDDIFDDIGGAPDWVFYLRPAAAFLPRGLLDCPVPTVGWLEDDFKFADLDHSMARYFDLAPTAYWEIERAFAEHGIDNRVCFNYFTASWLSPDQTFDDRHIDVAFIGHLDPHVSRARSLELEKLRRLARHGVRVFVHTGLFLQHMARTYAQSKIVFQHSGQGEPNLTYRVGEAMSAGALVLCRRPVRVGGLERPLVDREHIVYYDDFSDAEELIRYYVAHDNERERIANNGRRYVTEEYPWVDRIAQFVRDHVHTIPPNYLERRRERADRLGIDARRERLDYARYYLMGAGAGAVARRTIEEIPSWEQDAEARGDHAVASLFAGDAQQFAVDIAAVLSQDPDNVRTAYNYAVFVFQQRSALGAEQATSVLQRTIDLARSVEPKIADGALTDGIYMPLEIRRLRLEIAQAYLDYPVGEARARRVFALYLYQLYKCLGIVHYELGNRRDAITALSKALAVVPDDGYSMLYLGRAYAKSARVADAIRHYQRAVALEPFFTEAQLELARLLVDDKRGEEAVSFIDDVLLSHLEPDAFRAQLHILLGQAHVLSADRVAARRAFARGLEELRSRTVDTGVIRIPRPDAAISAEHVQRLQRVFESALDQLRSRGNAR